MIPARQSVQARSRNRAPQDWRTLTQENIDGRVWEGVHFRHSDEADPEPAGGLIYRDARWLVSQGPPETTMAGALKITSRRHFTDFAEMTSPEAASHPLRGTEFLNAPQHSDPADAERTARTIHQHLVS